MSRDPRLLTISAPTAAVLESATDELAARLEDLDPDDFAALPVVAETQALRGSARRAVAANSPHDAGRWLRRRDPRRVFTGRHRPPGETIFLFAGVGDQYPGLGAGLHRCLPVFRRELDRCLGLLATGDDIDLRSIMFAAESDARVDRDRLDLTGVFDRRETVQEVHRTAAAQPLMVSLQYALACALIDMGVKPTVLAGYSVGEYVAACFAGVLPLDAALRLVAFRACLASALDRGAMLAVMAGADALRPHLGGPAQLAAE